MEEDEFEVALKKEFLNEATELLDECEAVFLELEKDINSEDAIDRIFRAAHTIKGGALTVGLHSFGSFAHVFENLLVAIRNGDMSINSEIIDTLLKGNDKMREFITAVSANSEESVSCEGIADEIKSHTNSVGEKWALNAKKDSELESAQIEQISTIEPIVEESSLEKIWNGQGASFGKEQKVLVCDDEPDILDLLQEIVGLLGVTVIVANNAVEALKLLESESVDVIISDLKMPMMDGIEFIEEVRKTNLNVPVIFCSAFADRRELIKFMDLGAYGFIDKPFESERVEWMVRSALALKIMRDGVVKLSKLNFNAYINMVKILTVVEGDNINTKDLKALQIKLSEKLGDISSITNSLLKMRKH